MSSHHLPKAELHLHLDCSLSYGVVSAIDPSVSHAEYIQNFIAPAKCTDLADFLAILPSSIRLMQSEEHLKLVVRDLFDQLVRDNVIYAEIRFAPLLHTSQGLSASEVVGIVEKAVAESITETGVEARILLCTLRHFDEQQSLETVRLVDQYQGSYVVGFDIAADEAGYPITAHIKAFDYALERQIPCTAHGGEARGPDSVWEILGHFHPARLGHGVRSIEDPELIEHLRRNQIHLEVCPTCNIQTDIYPDFKDHVIAELYQAGLSLSVNTDGRSTSDITLNQEYQNLQQNFGWSEEQFLNCNIFALKAAFITQQTREKLMARLMAGYRQGSKKGDEPHN